MAEDHVAGEASEEGETVDMLEGLAGRPLGWRESPREGVLVFSALGLRTPFGMVVSRPGPGETGVLVFGEELKGWKPFIVILGSSSILRLDFRRLGSFVAISQAGSDQHYAIQRDAIRSSIRDTRTKQPHSQRL